MHPRTPAPIAPRRVPLAALLLLVNVQPPEGWIMPRALGRSDLIATLLVVALGASHGCLSLLSILRSRARAIPVNQASTRSTTFVKSRNGIACRCRRLHACRMSSQCWL